MKLWSRILLGAGLALLTALAAQAQTLSITGITASPSSARPGDSVTFSIAVSNPDTTAGVPASTTANFQITLNSATAGRSITLMTTGRPLAAIPAATTSGTAVTPGTGTFTATATIPTQTSDAGTYGATVTAFMGVGTAAPSFAGSFTVSSGVLTITGTPDFQITSLTYTAGTNYLGGSVIPMSLTYRNNTFSNTTPNVPYNGSGLGVRIQVIISSNAIYGDADDFRLTLFDFSSRTIADSDSNVNAVTLTGGGAGYTSPPTVSFTGGGGSGASGVGIINSAGAVTGIVLTSGGSGYTSVPSVVISGGGGAGATATAAISTPSSRTFSWQQLLPGNFSGSYYVLAKIDALDAVTETIESDLTQNGNNIWQDLAATRLALQPSTFPTIYLASRETTSSQRSASGYSDNPSLTSDGRYTAFASDAADLIASGDTNNARDIFLYDSQTSLVRRINLSQQGVQANGHSNHPSLSGNGRYVAFSSDATNLTIGDVNGFTDIFVVDTLTGAIAMQSITAAGAQVNGSSFRPSMSHTGRFLVFESSATNLVTPNTAPGVHIYLRDRDVSNSGTFDTPGNTSNTLIDVSGTTAGNAGASQAVISADGRYVAFSSRATNLTTPATTVGRQHVYVRDVTGATTTIVSVGTGGVEANADSRNPSINRNTGVTTGLAADGRHIAFGSDATNLIAGDTNAVSDVFVRDRVLATTTRVSVSTAGTEAVDPTVSTVTGSHLGSLNPSISSTGRYVVFASLANNLAPGDTIGRYNATGSGNGALNIYVRDRDSSAAGTAYDTLGNVATTNVSVNRFGYQSLAILNAQSTAAADIFPVISSDGRWVAFPFDSESAPGLIHTTTNLLSQDSNSSRDVALFDRRTNSQPSAATLPSVNITNPGNGGTALVNTAINVTASATTTTGVVSSVQFFVNGTSLGAPSTTFPYAATWTPTAVGNYVLSALVTDSFGNLGQSPNIAVTINAAPSVGITAPTTQSTITAGSAQTITASASASNPGATVTGVQFFVNGLSLGAADTTAPYSAAWTPGAAGSYTLTAVATDSIGTQTTSPAVTITVGAAGGGGGGGGGGTGGTPPTVSIAAPVAGATVLVNTPQTLTATATAVGGTVTQVDFLVNGTSVGTASTFPYTVSWTPTTPGTYAITATATNHNGLAATSTPVSVTVNTGTAPTVTILSPANGATIAAGTPQSISANATAATGNIVSVAFTANGVALGIDTTFPYNQAWTPGGPGSYTLTATATDSTGNQSSSTITVTVTGTLPTPPVVSLTTPVANAVITVNTPQTLIAAATASSGATIQGVDFYANGVLIGNDLVFPYSLTWTPSAVGAYSVTAVAIDSFGSQSTSNAVPVTVVAGSTSLPTVFLASTPTGTNATVGTPLFVSAMAEDPDGLLAGVEFYANNQLIGADAAAPFFVLWTPSTAGSYTITAVATDDAGNRVTSTAATITATARAGTVPAAALSFNAPGVDTSTGTAATPSPTLTPVQVTFGSRLIITAGAVDQDGTITGVQFFANGTSIGTATAAPFFTVWQLNTLNDVVITAIVTDSAGNSVYTNPLLIETLPSDQAGNSAVVLVSPRDGATYVTGGQIIFSATHNFGTVTPPKIDFYVNGQQFTTVSAPPYQAILGLTRAGTYTIHAVARAGSTTTVSAPARIVVGSNTAPSITITTPTSGGSFVVGSGLTIATSASDPDGTIQNVQFFVNGVALSSDNTTPYTAAWNPGAAGVYTLTALATDDAGNQTLSAPVIVTLTGNNPPTVAITSPTNGLVTNAGTGVTLSASATDADGTVTSVRFLANGVVVGSASAAPFNATWTPSAPGDYTIIAQATDSSGNVASSNPVMVTVATNQVPTVTLTSPANGATIRVGGGTTITATANDVDGTIASVTFFANGTAVAAADTTPPYTTSWTPTAEGIYRLTAIALDNSGGSTTSGVVTVLVVPAGGGDAVYTGNYAGAGESGRFAVVVIRGRTAAFVAFSTSGTSRVYFYPGLTVDASGGFSAFDAVGRSLVTGTASDTGVAGTLDNGRLTFIGVAGLAGSSSVQPGYYNGSLSGRPASTFAAIVSGDGTITIFAEDGSFRDAGTGIVSATGAFTVTTLAGNRFTGSVDPTSGFLSGSLQGGPGGSVMAALASGVSFSDGFLRNLSTRGQVGTGSNILIAGFVVGGNQPKRVLVRAIGPSLAPFGITNVLADTQLQIFNGASLVASNDNWGGSADISTAANVNGAFPLTPTSLDSAILMTLPPGSYTAQVSGVGGRTGVALVELYDADNQSPFSTQKVMNVATRGVVGTAQLQLIAGFTVSGNTAKKVLVRAVGPTLAAAPFNVGGVLADPLLKIVRSNGSDTIVRENDNWEMGNDISLIVDAASRVGAFPLASGSRDAAILISLPPGTYSAQVSGPGTTTGVALVEVYEVP